MLPPYTNELNRWLSKVENEETFAGECTLGVGEALKAHFLMASYFAEMGQPVFIPGPRSLALLESTLGRQQVSFGGQDKWTQKTELIGTLFYGMVKNHPFHDGNKRTAVLCALYQIEKCGLRPANPASPRPRHNKGSSPAQGIALRDLEAITLAVADGTLEEKNPRYKELVKRNKADADVQYLANWFHRHTRKLDKRFRVITYRELNTLLRHKGFGLEQPHANRINVVRYGQRRVLIGRETVAKRVATIGFPGWTKEVCRADIAEVRRGTGLTAEQGSDSEVFFGEEADLMKLIGIYDVLLKRLQDK